MPPKNRKQKEIVQDERLQAIVLTDSFETRFMPLTLVRPRCLLPLANVPLIDYTLEFLAKAGVNEVYLMCSSHADQIQQYIEQLRWAHNSLFSVTTVMSLELRSVGDAMRDLDNRGIITGDFLLVSGDVVTNIDFLKAMAFHKAKKAADKDHIVTMVLTEASPMHRARSPLDPLVFVLDSVSQRCHYYQGIAPAEGKRSQITIDPELLDDIEHDFVIRNDLIDCCVDICSPHVPQIFQENFDYQTLRGDFVRGVLTSDLLKKTIYAYTTHESEYAARVESWATYAAVAQDVLARWCYPLTPDANMVENTSYKYEFNHIYKEEKVVLAQSCRIGNSTCIGASTAVGASTAIAKSVIGRHCRIGANVVIKNSHIWDHAVIEDNAVVDNAIVASHAVIKAGAALAPGSVIGFNVVVGEGQFVPPATRIIDKHLEKDSVLCASFDSDASDEEPAHVAAHANANDTELVGDDGTGVLYMSERDLDDESELENNSVSNYSGVMYQLSSLNVSDESIASLTRRKTRRAMRRNSRNSRRMSATLMMSTDYEGGAFTEEEEDEEDFNKEAIATVERAMENNHDIDTALLELNTLRMSINVTYHERVVHFISTDTLNAKDAAVKVFGDWGALFERQVFNGDEQVDLAQIVQDTCVTLDPEHGPVLLFIALRQLYELDIIDEDNLLRWWESELSAASEGLLRVRKLTSQFIEWLRDAEEEMLCGLVRNSEESKYRSQGTPHVSIEQYEIFEGLSLVLSLEYFILRHALRIIPHIPVAEHLLSKGFVSSIRSIRHLFALQYISLSHDGTRMAHVRRRTINSANVKLLIQFFKLRERFKMSSFQMRECQLDTCSSYLIALKFDFLIVYAIFSGGFAVGI
ncbi:nucleotide-diphospho-sugar transferase [Metschnikowia bicuspidata var. bicuspidata NRRL YB-4993]|uniref:Translation initiation factor eIF2B subunit epsilon n=1 Tax=Metschnikowia bicuspidata var. bicuspidata NRRL YB-4993 TaxID=869754 RepID=A0A1A0HK25_9ASCO|nr:nucleotide-diphospho-sugar transferase [Metschnikowia bicuspidata var. bicuspidata NRRL YB-4993]OBA24237.1 nucleotide-diphospho-sugar transferase [Metschnikowia bicuspidata var. bicuspidata NRRL YB-4993]